ncbi:helix-turn-helix domain-containing protein [Streptosporangium sp. NPDC002607]
MGKRGDRSAGQHARMQPAPLSETCRDRAALWLWPSQALYVGLSMSAFLRLFRAQTGTTCRRYRLWARMLRMATLLETWPDLSTAAVEAGFAGPSHFSSAFHAMSGPRPSRRPHLLTAYAYTLGWHASNNAANSSSFGDSSPGNGRRRACLTAAARLRVMVEARGHQDSGRAAVVSCR